MLSLQIVSRYNYKPLTAESSYKITSVIAIITKYCYYIYEYVFVGGRVGTTVAELGVREVDAGLALTALQQ